MSNSKKILSNVIYNAFASFIPILILQLLVFPYLSRIHTIEMYGNILNIISVLSVISTGLGVSLNNVYLLSASKYSLEKSNSDFPLLLFFYSMANLVVIIFFGLYLKMSIKHFLLILLVSSMLLLKDFFLVLFLVDLDYKSVCVYNLWNSIGYLLGMIISKHTNCWEYIYIFGNLLPLMYIFKKKQLYKVKIKKVISKNFRMTIEKALSITGAAILNQFISYADRILLYPLMGGGVVAVYYVATLMGKTISQVIGPIHGVFLSYISKGHHNEIVTFKTTLIASGVLGTLIYMLCIFIAKPVLTILYPQMVEQSLKYVNIVTVTSIICNVNLLLTPFILVQCRNHWPLQLALETISIYMILSFTFWKINGLMGFCFANLFTNIIKLIHICYIYCREGKQIVKAE